MNVKHRSITAALIISTAFLVYSCKKNNNTTATPTTVYTNLDSITGRYTGITSGDSIYSYTDSITGQTKQWIHSFSWPDTLVVTAPDTATLLVTSKFYTATFAYGDTLTIVSVNDVTDVAYTSTFLQTVNGGQTNSFIDTTGGYDHLIVQLATSYIKSVNSNVTLLTR